MERGSRAVGCAARRLFRTTRWLALSLALVMLVGGCKSFYPVDIHTADGLAVVEPGEHVRVTTPGGEIREFDVTQVEPASIRGGAAHYTAAQIATLERLEFDGAKSLAFGTGVQVLVALVATAVIVASLTH